jgi:hypothetical protein
MTIIEDDDDVAKYLRFLNLSPRFWCVSCSDPGRGGFNLRGFGKSLSVRSWRHSLSSVEDWKWVVVPFQARTLDFQVADKLTKLGIFRVQIAIEKERMIAWARGLAPLTRM